MSSFKHQIAILSGPWILPPTLSNYVELLFDQRYTVRGLTPGSAK